MRALPVIFVHGGGHGAWCWEPTLAVYDQPAIAIDLPPASIRGGPGRNEMPAGIEDLTLADWADAVLAAADDAGFDRFVLVGHSLAGLTLGAVANVAPGRVAHLVFVSALVPRDGETGLDAFPAEFIEKVTSGLTENVVRDMFCSDLDEVQTRFVLGHFGTDAAQTMVEPVHRDAIPPELPKTYVRLARDHALSPLAQDASIAALRTVPGGTVEVIDLDCGHSVMISHPEELAAIVSRIAGNASPSRPVNEAERRRWNDPRWTGSWQPRERLTEAVTTFLVDATNARPGQRVLDVGCGGGISSLAVADVVGPDGFVVGLDLSITLTELARRRAADAGIENVSFVVADAQTDEIPDGPFDHVVSQFGVMFFEDPVAAFANLRFALHPDGRCTFICWQAAARNPWHSGAILDPFAPPRPPNPAAKFPTGPFAFADAARTETILTNAGFVEVRSIPVETSVLAPLSAVFDDGQLALLGIPDDRRADARTAFRDHLEQFRTGPDAYRFPLSFLVFSASAGSLAASELT